jgi:hypothetical protein
MVRLDVKLAPFATAQATRPLLSLVEVHTAAASSPTAGIARAQRCHSGITAFVRSS